MVKLTKIQQNKKSSEALKDKRVLCKYYLNTLSKIYGKVPKIGTFNYKSIKSIGCSVIHNILQFHGKLSTHGYS